MANTIKKEQGSTSDLPFKDEGQMQDEFHLNSSVHATPGGVGGEVPGPCLKDRGSSLGPVEVLVLWR